MLELKRRQQGLYYGIKNKKFGMFSWRIIRLILLLGLVYIIVFPVLNQFTMSLMSREDLLDHSVQFVPRNFNLTQIIYNYSLVWEEIEFLRSLLNTVLIVTLTSLSQLISCTFIGYGFARFKFRGRELFFALVILTLLVPPSMLMVPLYLNFRFFNILGIFGPEGINVLNSFWPLFLMSLTGMGLRNGLFIYLMRQHFRGIPKSLEEAALVDGAGYFKTFFKIMLPGAIPVMVTIFLFAFVWGYNDDIYASFLMPQMDILVNNLPRLWRPYIFDGELSRYNIMMRNIGMLSFIAPLLVLYAFMQRYFIESVERTGIVG